MMISSRPTIIVVILTTILSSSFVVQAVPAIVWKKVSSSSSLQHLDTTTTSNHLSTEIPFSNFVESSLLTNKDDDKWNVIFLMNRNIQTGQESITSMTPSLQQTLQLSLQQEQQQQQPIQYMHVSGIESGVQVVKTIQRTVPTNALDAQTTTPSIPAAVLIDLNELSYKLNTTVSSSSSLNDDTASVGMDGITNVVAAPSTATTSTVASAHTKATMKLSKRYRLIDQANWFIVTVPDTIDPTALDTILVQTIQHDQIQNVVLSGIRSVEEVKYERMLQMRRTLFSKTTIVGSSSSTGSSISNKYHRRLQEEGNAQDGGDSSDLSGIYYVQMTPNILAGLLFFAMFIVVALIGFSCMNMIAGQDVYVNVMPSIGREA